MTYYDGHIDCLLHIALGFPASCLSCLAKALSGRKLDMPPQGANKPYCIYEGKIELGHWRLHQQQW